MSISAERTQDASTTLNKHEAPVREVSGSVERVQSSTVICHAIVHEFLEKVQFSSPRFIRDLELEARVAEAVRTWGHKERLRPYVVTGLILTITAYNHVAHFETRVQITLFTIAINAMNDRQIYNHLSAREFHRRMCIGAVQDETGMLGTLMKVLDSMWDNYACFTANTIYASALRHVNAILLENKTDVTLLRSHDLPFVEYKRSITNTPEAYACFIWDRRRYVIRQAREVSGISSSIVKYAHPSYSDILSFYKEELVGERANYVHERAYQVRDILGEGEARAAFENFATGYISIYIDTPEKRRAVDTVLKGEM
ncbi:hypothetical protein IEO21_07959 [Rhodonia placenta]|uniref:Terpenoid synthase n=1 Tax=Rhodonia placenta TaxID=104341 RepID=A0A8H7TZT9_9APHY|nr:hypothetical protein IEO21_07959 [Postia placenta]